VLKSEVDTASLEENASDKNQEARSDLIGTDRCWAAMPHLEPYAGPEVSSFKSFDFSGLRELPMTGPTEQEIRTRAYELWKDAGEPQGGMDQLWYQAEKELLARKGADGEPPPKLNGHHKLATYQ
jgi:hypothetical protein